MLLKLFICKIDAELLKTVEENVSNLRKAITLTYYWFKTITTNKAFPHLAGSASKIKQHYTACYHKP
jgi:hypothetical protein